MESVTLGKTGITVNKNGFGALPIQRISDEEAVHLLRKAYENGITFFDTARAYSDSEHKLGLAFQGMWDKVYVASKTAAVTPEDFWKDLQTSLTTLGRDYLDLYQFHNPSFCPRPGDGSGLYECMLEAKEQGKIRHIGITNHRLAVAEEAIDSGLYETQFAHVLPIWGVQRESELDEFLSYVENPPALTEELEAVISHDRQELQGEFCRGCGYCMPCPAGIEINNCARMSLMIRRAPSAAQLTPEMQEKMLQIENCLHCGKCKSKCPYNLDTPALLERNLKDYKEILAGKAI